MDMNSEQQFISNFKSITEDSTLIVVSHRMPLLNLVDRVLVMNDGKIVDDGPKDEILEKLQPKT
jgi:ATP-binding cassette subfamily C protein LapB